jgi:hypothetical protein
MSYFKNAAGIGMVLCAWCLVPLVPGAATEQQPVSPFLASLFFLVACCCGHHSWLIKIKIFTSYTITP